MKVLSRTDRVPITLMTGGSLMVIASSFEFTVRNATFLFLAGWSMVLFGFLLFAIPALGAYLRRKQRIRARLERDRQGPTAMKRGGRTLRR